MYAFIFNALGVFIKSRTKHTACIELRVLSIIYILLIAKKRYREPTLYIVYYKHTMVRATKTEKPTATATVPVVASAEAAKPKKTAAPKKETVVAAPVAVVEAPVVVEVVKVETSSSSKFNELTTKVQQLTALLSSIKADLKTLEKTVAKEQKIAQKNSKTARKSSGNRNPSGFAKPTKISDALASFLGKESGVEMARTEVSKEITKYIKENNLQLATNKRIITPDNKLAVLLNYKEGTEPLSYFNLQKYISPHFIKAVPLVPVVAL